MPFAFQLHTISGLLLMLLLYRNLSHSLRVSLSTRWAEANTFTKIRSFSLLWKCHYYHVTAQDITPSCQQTSHIVVQPLQSFPGHWKLLPNWVCKLWVLYFCWLSMLYLFGLWMTLYAVYTVSDFFCLWFDCLSTLGLVWFQIYMTWLHNKVHLHMLEAPNLQSCH